MFYFIIKIVRYYYFLLNFNYFSFDIYYYNYNNKIINFIFLNQKYNYELNYKYYGLFLINNFI